VGLMMSARDGARQVGSTKYKDCSFCVTLEVIYLTRSFTSFIVSKSDIVDTLLDLIVGYLSEFHTIVVKLCCLAPRLQSSFSHSMTFYRPNSRTRCNTRILRPLSLYRNI